MICFICNRAETLPGKTSILLERGHLSLTINKVPARVCPHCGEAYADEAVALALLRKAEQLAKAGVKVDAHPYALSED
jgi:YgiT-type zinc finger domain-containing protein